MTMTGGGTSEVEGSAINDEDFELPGRSLSVGIGAEVGFDDGLLNEVVSDCCAAVEEDGGGTVVY